MTLQEAAAAGIFFTSDSRQVQAGAVFVALAGEKVDGHQYVQEVLAKNPIAVVVQSDFESNDAKIIKVANTHQAHKELASLFRKKFTAKIIAVGGSNGKTTTKEFIFTLLSSKYRCIKTAKSQNGDLGIPKTLEQLRADTQIAVIEVGIDAPGDMQRHANLVKPDVAILTSIGQEHLNLLKSVQNVFKEEKTLFEVTIACGGKCFAPQGDEWLKTLLSPKVNLTEPFPTVIDTNFVVSFQHVYALQNAALAIRVALDAGMNRDEICRVISKLELPEGRGNLLRLRKDLIVVSDHYNANPSSLQVGLEYVGNLATEEGLPLRLIIGDMLDLGPESTEAHSAVLPFLIQCHPSEIILIGPEMAKLAAACKKRISTVHVFENSKLAKDSAKAMAEKSGIIFLKGSRGMELEHCFDAMKAHAGTRAPQGSQK